MKSYDGTWSKYITDGHGDVVGLYGLDGVKTTDYKYDPFGVPRNDVVDTNPFRYCGEYADVETGYIYLRNRYYSPASGRFITEDPIKDGLNWYVYCGSNPIIYIDPSGLEHYVVFFVAGIMTESGFFHYLQNEMQWRFGNQGDTAEFIEVFPYGTDTSASAIGQCVDVLSDLNDGSHIGGIHLNSKITDANIGDSDNIMIIGHSGGGVAAIDAFNTMDNYHRSRVTQVVTIGAPQKPVLKDAYKTTRIADPIDLVRFLGNNQGKLTGYWQQINNNYKNSVHAHMGYFSTADRAAKILDVFWGRATPRRTDGSLRG